MAQVQGPKLRDLQLWDLEDGDAAELAFSAQADRVILDGLDLSGLDLSGGRLSESILRGVTLSDADLTAATVAESIWERVNAPHLKAPRSTWRNVRIQDSRIGVGELYDAGISGLVLRGCKVDLLNLRNTVISDLLIENCTIGELDISGARVHRMTIMQSSIGTFEAREARLKDVDLRGAQLSRIVGLAGLKGAVISQEQLVELAPSLAGHLGLVVED